MCMTIKYQVRSSSLLTKGTSPNLALEAASILLFCIRDFDIKYRKFDIFSRKLVQILSSLLLLPEGIHGNKANILRMRFYLVLYIFLFLSVHYIRIQNIFLHTYRIYRTFRHLYQDINGSFY